MKTALSLSSFILVGVTVAAFTRTPVFAQTESDSLEIQTSPGTVSSSEAEAAINRLTAIPPRLGDDLSLKGLPGQTIQTTVRVKNTSSESITVMTAAEDFIIGEDGEQPIPVTEETPNSWSLTKWMTITPPVNTLSPNESATINVLIEVPEDARPGGHYAMIMHQPGAGDFALGGSTAGISQKVGTLVYFYVEGDIHEEAFIRQLDVKNLFENGPIPFSFEIDNQSDIHISPQVSVEMKNMLGQQSGVISLEGKNIFPGTSRGFSGEWAKQWGFGRYTGEIIASYGTSGKIVREVFSFWMIPIKLIIGVIVFLTLLIGGGIFFKKKMSGNTDQKNQEIEILRQKVESLQKDKTAPFTDEKH